MRHLWETTRFPFLRVQWETSCGLINIGAANNIFPLVADRKIANGLLSHRSQVVRTQWQAFRKRFALGHTFFPNHIEDNLYSFLGISRLVAIDVLNKLRNSVADVIVIRNGIRTELDIFWMHDLGAEEAKLEDDVLDAQVRCLLLQTVVPAFKCEFTSAVLKL